MDTRARMYTYDSRVHVHALTHTCAVYVTHVYVHVQALRHTRGRRHGGLDSKVKDVTVTGYQLASDFSNPPFKVC